MTNFQNQNEKINEFLNSLQLLELNLSDLITADDITDYENAFEEIKDFVENDLCVDVIYYSKAINFLRENDPSLSDSLELAKDLGYTVDRLNSEVLASLLASDMNANLFYEMEDKITEFFNRLGDEDEDEDNN